VVERISKETGWRVDFIPKDLKEAWGWNTSPQSQHSQQMQQTPTPMHSYQHQTPTQNQVMVPHQQQQPANLAPPQPQQPRPDLSGPKVNPMYRTADFSLPVHPYQQHWVAPAGPPSANPNVFPNNINYGQYTYG